MRTVCITGTGHGLGFALCEEYISRGARVIAGFYPGTEGAIRQMSETTTGRLLLKELDIGDDESAREFGRFAGKLGGRVDLLVNNAGILGRVSDTLESGVDYGDILRVINVNAVGPLRVIGAILPHLGEGAMIVNISSSDASVSGCERRDSFGYCMSKAALNMMSAIVSNDLTPRGISLVNVHPGWMRTFMTGTEDTEAELSAEEAAGRIARMADERAFAGRRPLIYVDNLGNQMEY